MSVEPAASLAVMGRRNRNFKLVLVNLQETEKDKGCDLRIFATTDEVMKLLMEELALEIPPYKNLNLQKNEKWLAEFKKHYRFRSAPSSDWFEGPEDPTILKENVGSKWLNSVTSSPTGRYLARAVKDVRPQEQNEIRINKGELLEVLRVNALPEPGKSWCYVAVINKSSNENIRLGYTLEDCLLYI